MPSNPACRPLALIKYTIAGVAIGVASLAVADEPPISPAAAARQARMERQLAANPSKIPSIGDTMEGYGFFDIRSNPNGTPAANVNAALESFNLTAAGKARAAAAAALRGSLPELAIDDDIFLGTPRFVRSTRVFLTAPIDKGIDKVDDSVLTARYIRANSALFEIDPLEIAAARISRDFRTDHNGVHHLSFQQQIRGRDLFGSEVSANFTRDQELINISSTMLPRPAGDFVAPVVKFGAADAIVAAAANVGITLRSRPVAAAPDAKPDEVQTTWIQPAELRADEPVVTVPVYFPVTRTDIRPAYTVIIPVPGYGHTYDFVVDASTGQVLWRADRLVWDTTQPMQFRVFTQDSPAPLVPARNSPDGFQAPLVERDLVTINPADIMAINPNGWIPDGSVETVGNNVDAHTDLDSNNTVSGSDLPRPQATLDPGTGMRIFDFPCDLAQAPSAYRNAAVTQLFYIGNWYHDKLYALGFNEVSGNFQTNNFGRGGSATGDAVQADTQDGAGLTTPNANNANFATTGSDGSTARVQMYIFTGPTPDRDGDLDNYIIIHEFTHGTSIRLHRGLNATQSAGMGEGWSDFYACAMLTDSSDDPNAVYAMGPYATYQLFTATFANNYYYGIRRYPYCTDLNKNPLTFKFIDTTQGAYPAGVPRNASITSALSEVHNVGEVWCMMLWEARAAVWGTDGPSANQTMLQLVTDAMKLSVSAPTFVQSRDAILQADMVNNAAAHRIPLWTAFAKRGVGSGAVAPANTGTTGVVESYQTPFTVTFSYPDGRPAQLAPGVATAFRVSMTPVDLAILPDTLTMHVSVNGGADAPTVLTQNPSGDYVATIPAQACFSNIKYWFTVNTNSGTRTDPAGALPSNAYSVAVVTGSSPMVNDTFEIDSGWTVGPNTATTGLWTRGDPIGTTAQPEDDHTPAPGVNCWFTGQGAVGGMVGNADVDGGYTTLLSPVFNLSTASDARVSYWRWYSNGVAGSGAPFEDTFRVDISTDNGANWTNAETVGPANSADTNPGWRFASWTLSQIGVTPSATVRIRFVADDAGAGSVVEAALDDFAIEALTCTPPTTCAGDFNHDGAASVQDIFDFLAAFFANDTAADINHSGAVTVQDIFDFLTAYFVGC